MQLILNGSFGLISAHVFVIVIVFCKSNLCFLFYCAANCIDSRYCLTVRITMRTSTASVHCGLFIDANNSILIATDLCQLTIIAHNGPVDVIDTMNSDDAQ